jgi:hypothetical protein
LSGYLSFVNVKFIGHQAIEPVTQQGIVGWKKLKPETVGDGTIISN